MKKTLKEFNQERTGQYAKDEGVEHFFLRMNRVLMEVEQKHYQDYEIEHPFIFIFGAPRSGTTLLSQLLAACLDVGYINNLMARFWLAPIHGIKLSHQVYGNLREISFQSDYARTSAVTDIHEFGYFWRFWLKKEEIRGVTHAREIESEIDWEGLRKTLANMQHEFQKAMVFKNIFGSYHLHKLREVLGKVIYLYIERDPRDSAISILEARKKYYRDPNTWWSYMPLEYELLKDKDYMEQIAGQVFFLQKYYREQIASFPEIGITIQYETLCHSPRKVLEEVIEKTRKAYGEEITVIHTPPRQFPFRTYNEREEEKEKFGELFDKFAQDYGNE
ncbi:MAG: hypothetical protein D6748_08070 [Calditrichaeota bacterium]|nr:MAG: hypothetical protein D6748_08070 [Calditrichota bacterium]